MKRVFRQIRVLGGKSQSPLDESKQWGRKTRKACGLGGNGARSAASYFLVTTSGYKAEKGFD